MFFEHDAHNPYEFIGFLNTMLRIRMDLWFLNIMPITLMNVSFFEYHAQNHYEFIWFWTQLLSNTARTAEPGA